MLLPEEFKYPGILFLADGKREGEMNQKSTAAGFIL